MDVRHIEGDICPQTRLIDESPSCPAGAEAFCCIIEPFSNWGREPHFPALTPHREVPYPIYMSPYQRGGEGGVLMSCEAEVQTSKRLWALAEVCQRADCVAFLTLILRRLDAQRGCQMEKRVS